MARRQQRIDPDLKRKHHRVVELLEPKNLFDEFHALMEMPGTTYEQGAGWIEQKTGQKIGATSVFRYWIDRKQKLRRMQERSEEASALMKELRTKGPDEMAAIRDTLIFNQFLAIQDELKDAPIDKLALRMVQGQEAGIKKEALELERQKVDIARQMLEFKKETAAKAKAAVAEIPVEKLRQAANPEDLKRMVQEAVDQRLGL